MKLTVLTCTLATALTAVSCCLAEDDDFHTRLMRATVKIDHDSATATGFILVTDEGKRILVTSAHVFQKTEGDETKVVFRVKQAEGEYKKEPIKLPIRKDKKPLWTQHPKEDVAAIAIAPPKDADLASVPIDAVADELALRQLKFHPGENLYCLGYPHREESGPAGFAILRLGAAASYPLLPTSKTRTFYLSANTFEGDSGGPVYLSRGGGPEAGANRIVGVVAAQVFIDEDMKMIYGSSKLRHRLGLAIVVHAPFIRATIDLLK